MQNQRKPRSLRYSARTLLLGFAVLCISLAWVGWRVDRVRRQERAIDLLKAKGTFLYRNQFDPFGIAMARLTGKWNFGDVSELVLAADLYKPLAVEFSQQDIDRLKDLPCLTKLEICWSQREETIIRIAELDSLKFVGLHANSANDPGVATLKKLRPDIEVVTK